MSTTGSRVAKRQGDRFNDYMQVVDAYEQRGLSLANAYRQAAIDYPELHNKWGAANGAAHTKMRSEARARRTTSV